MLKLGIRVSNNINVGRGHFERCLSISYHIGYKIYWFLDYKSEFFEKKIHTKDEIFYEKKNDKIDKLLECLSEKNINVALIDSYSIAKKDISNLAKIIPVCIFQDKIEFINVQMIICPHPINIKKKYGNIILNGPKFAPIAKKFLKKKENYNFDSLTILVSMGAYDSSGVTLNVIEAINNFSIKDKFNLKTIIILAKGSSIINKVKLLIKKYRKFELIIDPKDMVNIYNLSDIAIGAPGLSHLERLYMGLPTILIAQNNIHELLVDGWVNLGCAIKSENKINLIEQKLADIINNKKIKNKLIYNGIKVVDGKGSLRIANSILKLV